MSDNALKFENYLLLLRTLEKPFGNPAEGLILAMLASLSDVGTRTTLITHAELAKKCCMGVSSLKTHIKALKEKNLIDVTNRRANGRVLPCMFTLLF